MKISSTKSSKADLDDDIVFCYHLKSFLIFDTIQDLIKAFGLVSALIYIGVQLSIWKNVSVVTAKS